MTWVGPVLPQGSLQGKEGGRKGSVRGGGVVTEAEVGAMWSLACKTGGSHQSRNMDAKLEKLEVRNSKKRTDVFPH